MSAVVPGGAFDKRSAVRVMFDRIAPRYDLMNALMTFGRDRSWRRRAARAAAVPPGGLVLDIGTGTGDLAYALAAAAPSARIIGIDYAAAMLARAPRKARRHRAADRLAWLAGDGLRLPFADGTFDAVASAFVLRNLVDLDAAFAEMARVTRAGGRVVALEISPDVPRLWRTPYGAYFGRVVPLIGAAVARDRVAYTYLPASVSAFAHPSDVADMMRTAGLEPLTASRLMFGSVVIHVGVRPPSRPALPGSPAAYATEARPAPDAVEPAPARGPAVPTPRHVHGTVEPPTAPDAADIAPEDMHGTVEPQTAPDSRRATQPLQLELPLAPRRPS